MHIVSIVGARPNFVKIAPIARACKAYKDIKHTIIHTGQHYDKSMSDSFFEVLDIPQPDINLNIGSASHGVQTGKIMMEIEPVLMDLKPDYVLTVGDVNSTAAASMVAVKLGIKTIHVEAGLRSNDRTMPEEINRLVTDVISDLLFITEDSAKVNLANEGVPENKVFFTGNVMIDSLVYVLPKLKETKAWEDFDLEPGYYVLVTLHRPSNVDDPDSISGIMKAIGEVADVQPVLFPIHPRTRKNLEKFGLMDEVKKNKNIILTDPLDYLHFLSLVSSAKALMTDSGGIQEETTFLGIPCITLRPNTERPVTIEVGTNELIAPEYDSIIAAFKKLNSGSWKKGEVPPLWDGHAAERIIKIVKSQLVCTFDSV